MMGLHDEIAKRLVWLTREGPTNPDDRRVEILAYRDEGRETHMGYVSENTMYGRYYWCVTARGIQCKHTVTKAKSKRRCMEELEYHVISELYKLLKKEMKHGKRNERSDESRRRRKENRR